jgi:hypothetical protein
MSQRAGTPKSPGTHTPYREPSLFDQIARRAVEILMDGQWHDEQQVIRDLSRLIPPGVAMRRNERDRRMSTAGRQAPDRPTPSEVPPRKYQRAPDKLIASGARAILREVFQGNTYEIKDGQIRLKRLPRAVRGDQLRASWLQPILNALAETMHHEKLPVAVEHVRATAHDNGFHLDRCPKGCQLGGAPFPQDWTDVD